MVPTSPGRVSPAPRNVPLVTIATASSGKKRALIRKYEVPAEITVGWALGSNKPMSCGANANIGAASADITTTPKKIATSPRKRASAGRHAPSDLPTKLVAATLMARPGINARDSSCNPMACAATP